MDVLLSKVNSLRLQTLFIGVYISIYLIPVGYVVIHKLKVKIYLYAAIRLFAAVFATVGTDMLCCCMCMREDVSGHTPD